MSASERPYLSEMAALGLGDPGMWKWVRERDHERPHFNQYRCRNYLARVYNSRSWELFRDGRSLGVWMTLRAIKKQVSAWEPSHGMGAVQSVR